MTQKEMAEEDTTPKCGPLLTLTIEERVSMV